MNTDLLASMTEQGGVFSAAQAAECGINRDARRKLVDTGRFHELRRGIYTLTEFWDAADSRDRHRMHVAAALLIRGWDASSTASPLLVGGHRSAGFLHHLPLRPKPAHVEAVSEVRAERPRSVPRERAVIVQEAARLARDEGPWHVHLVSSGRSLRTYRNGVEVRPAALPPGHITRLGKVPVTSLARTAVDLMRDGTFADAVITADAVLHRGVPKSDLTEVAEFCSGWSNAKQAIAAIEFADGKAESAAESLARVVCHQGGFTDFELQVRLFDGDGLIGRVDLLFRMFRVVLEIDGEIKYLDPWYGTYHDVLADEAERERRLVAAGWIVVRTTWAELVERPHVLLRRLGAAFASRGAAA
jgi:hypothetical protein